MLKIIFTSLIIYFIYRYFIQAPALHPSDRDAQPGIRNNADRPAENKDEGEYIDYEEVD